MPEIPTEELFQKRKDNNKDNNKWSQTLKLNDGSERRATFDSKTVDKNSSEWETINRHLQTWGKPVADGSTPILNSENLIAKKWEKCEAVLSQGRHVTFFYPEEIIEFTDNLHLLIESLTKLNSEMELILNTDRFPTELVNYYLLPFASVPRAFAPGASIFLGVSSSMNYEIPAHEKVHAELHTQFGNCLVPSLVEGAALYFTHQRFHAGSINATENQFQISDIISAVSESIPMDTTIPLTWFPKVVRELLPSSDIYLHMFKYPLGALFSDFFINIYDLETFRKLYELTSDKIGRLTDPVTGKTVIDNNVIIGTIEEVLAAGLSVLGLDKDAVGFGLRKYIASLRV